MKTIGLLGGMSWESTLTYYTLINQGIRDQLGGLHSAKLVLYSVEFAEIEKLQNAGQWEEAGRLLASAAQKVEGAGAEALLICTNTMHKVAPQVEAAIDIPLLHIADATGRIIAGKGMKKVGLLGTRFTMEEDFYKGRLTEKFGIEVIIPSPEKRDLVHRVIYDELCCGKIKEASKDAYVEVVSNLGRQGAEAVILGCTEISLLIKEQDASLPLLDTTAIHAREAVRFALEE
jgi:aspartate racemase